MRRQKRGDCSPEIVGKKRASHTGPTPKRHDRAVLLGALRRLPGTLTLAVDGPRIDLESARRKARASGLVVVRWWYARFLAYHGPSLSA